jgi:metallo-beta-lactamase family protein
MASLDQTRICSRLLYVSLLYNIPFSLPNVRDNGLNEKLTGVRFMKLTFLGATETVTGSKYLLTHNSKKILIDCGLFQGYKELRLRNWAEFPIDPHTIDAVILTHAHIDHTGYLPLLIKNGFNGKVYSTPGTKALCAVLLPDSGHLQEEEARAANRYGSSKHKPALPLYTEEDAKQALNLFETIDFGQSYSLFDDLSFTFSRAGHIIGSAFIKIKQGNTSLVFTGDMGRPHDPIMRAPEIIEDTDYLVVESTYGNRLHDATDPKPQLGKIINETIKRGGSVIIPAFAVGRAQSLLYYIYELKNSGEIPDVPVYLDSPMAIKATHILCTYKNEHRLNEETCTKVCNIATYTNTPDESKMIDLQKNPMIVISASGMATGGRILHHLKTFASDAKNTILFTGYQAGGTRGADMVSGKREIKIYGQIIPVNAHIEQVTSTSAHADYKEILEWLSHFHKPPLKVFITHGEANAAVSLKNKIEEQFNWTCTVPHYQQIEVLE